MVFTKRLRERIRSGRIRCSVRIWQRLHVKVGGRYPMDDGHIVVDAIERIRIKDITYDLARESGFDAREGPAADGEARPRQERVPDSIPLPGPGHVGHSSF